jgi:bifunctional non-homologous end joining protein LigD
VAFVKSPNGLASVYVGREEDGGLVYAGKAATGLTREMARELRTRLDPLVVSEQPLVRKVRKPKATWVRPDVLAEVEYRGFTEDGLLRHASFKGVREDLNPANGLARGSTQPTFVPKQNILQLLPDAVVPSPEMLKAYWRKVGKRALAHLGGHPLKLVRSVHGTTFYHKGRLPEHIPETVHQLRLEKPKGANVSASGWITSRGCSASWTSAWSKSTPGRRRPTTSDIRMCWSSTSIPAKASNGHT